MPATKLTGEVILCPEETSGALLSPFCNTTLAIPKRMKKQQQKLLEVSKVSRVLPSEETW